jgi:uncharacterized protein (TIGR03085 family)
MPVDLARSERAALSDLFLAVGPDAPTLCEGWATRDLAAHLVVRERRPDAAIGIVVPPLAHHGDRVRDQFAERPYAQLVADVRGGPPIWSPMRVPALDRATNTMEYFIHHEDVRRAQPGWEPRDLDAATSAELWAAVKRMTRLMFRHAPAGVVLVSSEGERHLAKDASPAVEVKGTPAELALFAFGRQAHSRVELTGPADAVEALRRAHFGV